MGLDNVKGHQTEKRRTGIEHWKMIAIYLLCYDIIVINASYFFALLLRFDFKYSAIPSDYLRAFFIFAPIYTVLTIVVFYCLRLYNSLWRFASFSELSRLIVATVITGLIQAIGVTVFVRRMPISYYVFGTILQFLFILGIRFSYRFVTLERSKREKSSTAMHRAMVIGAGAAGQLILKELKQLLLLIIVK